MSVNNLVKVLPAVCYPENTPHKLEVLNLEVTAIQNGSAIDVFVCDMERKDGEKSTLNMYNSMYSLDLFALAYHVIACCKYFESIKRCYMSR